jgi:hypothetical protein
MNAILAGHLIDPAAMRSDDFRTFFDRRFEALLTIISEAMGKKIDFETPTEPDLDNESEPIEGAAL